MNTNPVHVKFMDGSPVPDEYLKKITALIDDACEAEEVCGIDECEAYTLRLIHLDQPEDTRKEHHE